MKIYHSSVQKEVVHIISKTKRIKPSIIREKEDLSSLGFDLLDVVEILLKVEESFNLIIPDDIPISTVDDIVSFVNIHTKHTKSRLGSRRLNYIQNEIKIK